jgi:ligand-binding sensor domain-containing protein
MHKETKGGLKTELVRGIATGRDGSVFIASRAGVAMFDGRSWTYPELLRDPVNDVAVGRDGRVWMTTDHGLAVYDGIDVRTIDVHRGMLENQLDEAVVDAMGRVWVRSSKGISIVAP